MSYDNQFQNLGWKLNLVADGQLILQNSPFKIIDIGVCALGRNFE